MSHISYIYLLYGLYYLGTTKIHFLWYFSTNEYIYIYLVKKYLKVGGELSQAGCEAKQGQQH